MKTAFIALLMMLASAISVSAQSKATNKPPSVTYAIVDGKVVETTKIAADKVKADDPLVYTSSNGTKFYRGSKGGTYYWKISAKTGKLYKCYIK